MENQRFFAHVYVYDGFYRVARCIGVFNQCLVVAKLRDGCQNDFDFSPTHKQGVN